MAGGLSLEDAARVVALRSRAIVALSGRGGMVSVLAPVERVSGWLSDGLQVAVVNGPEQVVVSGAPGELDVFVGRCEAGGVQVRRIAVDYASHSPQVEGLRAELLDVLGEVGPRSGVVPLVSTVSGEVIDTAVMDAGYWFRNLRQTVRFDRALETLLEAGHRVFIEASPHPVLLGAVAQNADHKGVTGVTAVGTLRRDEPERAQLLRHAAEVFVTGVDVDWPVWTGDGRLVDLPVYPFQHRRYWQPAVTGADVGAVGLDAVRHPFLGAALTLAGGDDIVLTGRLSRTAQPWLADHAVFGTVILPGTAFVELALRAAEEAGCAGVRDLTLHAPLSLPEHGETDLQVQVGAAGATGRTVEVHSRPHGTQEWTHHASGLLVEEPAAAPEPGRPPYGTAWPPERAHRLDPAAHYAALAGTGLEYGPAFQGLSDVWRSGDEVFAQVTLPGRQAEDAARFTVHPALLDAALQAAAARGTENGTGRTPLPFSFGRITVYGRGASELRIRIAPSGPDTFTVDAADPAGTPVARIDSLLVRTVTADDLTLPDSSTRALLSVEWTEHDRAPAADGDPGAPEPTLLKVTGAEADTGDTPARVRGVLHETLRRLQEWLSRDRSAGERLVVVTRGAVATGAETDGTRADLAHAAVWGLVRAARAENPGRIVLVDTDPGEAGTGLDENDTGRGQNDTGRLARLDEEILGAVRSGRPELALRSGRRYVPALRRQATDPAGDARDTLGTGTVLITGGTTGIGAQVARHAARLGARHLLLLSRRGPQAEGVQALRDELTAAGAEVTVLACDVADRAQLEQALREVPERYPLTAVVHSAGVLHDGTIESVDADGLDRVLRPKTDAAWHLHELTAAADLSAFVVFSSVAGVLGGAGQGGYAAANAFLDALMEHRRRTGLPGLSLAWGLWAEATGMTGHLAETDLRRISRGGISPLATEQGLTLLDAALTRHASTDGTGHAVLVAAALNLPVLRTTEPALLPPLLAAFAPARRRAAVPASGPRAGTAGFVVPTNREAVVERLRYRFARTMGFDAEDLDPAASLVGQGLDSVMAMQIRSLVEADFGQSLPIATMFNGATIDSIADHIVAEAERTGPDGAAPASPASAADPSDTDVPDIAHHPATRDVVRLLRAEQHGTPSVTHHIGLAVRLDTPTTADRLTEAISRLAGRHAALRTAIVADTDGGQRLEVRRTPAGELVRWTEVEDGTDPDRRLCALMEPPFDLTRSPLWRFELLAYPSGDQTLVFGAHHAVSDLASLMLVAHELGTELTGQAPPATVTNRDIDLLLRAQAAPPDRPGAPAGRRVAAGDWREEFAGVRRLDLELARPRPARRSHRSAMHLADLPSGLARRVADRATRLGITPAAFWLGALTLHLARLRDRDRFVLAVPVDTRMHVGALDAVGYFGLPIPFAAQVEPGDTGTDVLRRTDGRLSRVLERGITFFDAMPALVQEGLYRKDAPLVEVYFNYMPPQAGAAEGLRVLPAGTGYSDLDLMVTVMPGLGKVGLEYNTDVLDDANCAALAEGVLAVAARLADAPETVVVERAAGASAAGSTTATAGPAPDGIVATPGPHHAPAEAAPHGAPVTTQAPAPTARDGAPADGGRPAGQIAVAATFALGNLPALLTVALEDTGVEGGPYDVAEAPYHQVLAALHDPDGVLAQPATAAGLILLRPGDLTRFAPQDTDLLGQLAEEYPAALRALADRTRTPLVVAFLPERSRDERLRAWERQVTERLADQPGIAVLSADSWAADLTADGGTGPGEAAPGTFDGIFDQHTDDMAHLPFQEEFQAVVALRLADVVWKIRRRAPKVIVVDGDETLWSGIAGETGPENVDLTGPRALLARRLLQWRAAGVLLALVSNNDEETVHSVLDRPDSPLRREHFAAISAAWEPKWTRIARIAEDLNLGLDSFLFLDDNPVEIAGVRAQLPEVLSLTCPPAAELADFVTRLWPMVPRAATTEDASRAEFYQQERVRDAARAQMGFADFLANLKLELDIEPVGTDTAERTIQLSRRTNQFNLRPLPLDAARLERLRQEGEVWTATARDRFGAYGQIGVLAVRPDDGVLEVVAWMMSCRVLGRGVEDRLLAWLADRADALGCTAVRLVAENTPRNIPARRLVSRLGGGEVDAPRLETALAPEQLREFRSWDLGSDIAAEVSNA
ncbi:HAD-IIIC family phosphatase [Streptomyces sp. NPDC002343]